jgi:methylmalonyl-CoA mutase
MTELTAEFKALANYRPQHKVRFVTAASLFDGHDASINIMRRILQGMGAEVIHLGHNRSVDEIVTAALQEDAQGIAISSYQGGHVEYFKYMVDLLKARRRAHPGLRRRRRRDRAGRDPRAAGLRRGPHLQPRGRPAHGPAGHDRRDGDALRPGPVALAPRSLDAITGHGPAAWRALAQLITALENGRPTRPWWPSCTSAPPRSRRPCWASPAPAAPASPA